MGLAPRLIGVTVRVQVTRRAGRSEDHPLAYLTSMLAPACTRPKFRDQSRCPPTTTGPTALTTTSIASSPLRFTSDTVLPNMRSSRQSMR